MGDILAGWRYDISGLSPAMRTDYEQHLSDCDACHSRQRLHRTIDVVLIGLTTASILLFCLVLSVIHHVEPLRHWAIMTFHLRQMEVILSLQEAAVGGLLFSMFAWILVAVATPVPTYLSEQARVLQNGKLGHLRERFPKMSA